MNTGAITAKYYLEIELRITSPASNNRVIVQFDTNTISNKPGLIYFIDTLQITVFVSLMIIIPGVKILTSISQ